jgi:hypothetical protein
MKSDEIVFTGNLEPIEILKQTLKTLEDTPILGWTLSVLTPGGGTTFAFGDPEELLSQVREAAEKISRLLPNRNEHLN